MKSSIGFDEETMTKTPMCMLLPTAIRAGLLTPGSAAEELLTFKAADPRFEAMSTIKQVALEQLLGVAVLWSYVSRRHNAEQVWQAECSVGWGPVDLMPQDARSAFDLCSMREVAERMDRQVVMVDGLLGGVAIAAERDRENSRRGTEGTKRIRAMKEERFKAIAPSYKSLDRDDAAKQIGERIGLGEGAIRRYMSKFFPGKWRTDAP